HVLKGSNTSLTLLALPRDASETPTSLYNAGAEHVALGFHETGELEAFWTEAAGPAGALATHMSGPHIQHDLLPYNGSAWSYHPDRTGPDGTLNGLNPSVIPSSDGLVHVIWGSPAFNTISHRKG
ncbi:MAG TPA: hypothetical protein VEI97_19525, partial [bacterium]|nr:hypothetical protein [bacterium]